MKEMTATSPQAVQRHEPAAEAESRPQRVTDPAEQGAQWQTSPRLSAQRAILQAAFGTAGPWAQAGGPAHGTVIQRKGYDELLAVKTRNEHEFIRTLFGSSFGTGVWKFPKQRDGDGIMGKNCISAAHSVPVTGATENLALHINFMVTAGSFNRPAAEDGYSTLVLKLKLLHLTARSTSNQISIVEDGPSIISAARSIHCGPGNDWDWTEGNVAELLTDIGATLPNLQTALASYGRAQVAGLRADLRAEMTRAARNREVDVTFEGDSTWG